MKFRKVLSLLLFVAAMPLMAEEINPESIRIELGPYLQAVGENEFTVCWKTNMPSVGWIEVAPDDGTHFYQCERPKYHDARFGRRRVGEFHKVTIKGLEPGKTYRYRVMQNSVLLDEGRKRMLYGEGYGSDILKHKPYQVTTLDPQKKSVKFAVGNDFHEHDGMFRDAFANARKKGYDFVLLNGDMTTSIESEKDIFDNYLKSACELFASDVPFYMARGNHENRGKYAINYMDYYPSLSGRPYYAFRQGPVFFLVLDGGEDKPDNDIRNLDIMVSDQFRAEEVEWLKDVLASKEYKEAPVKIAFLHMPPNPTKSGWYGVNQISKLFTPLLNEAGIDLMISGHTHKYAWIPAGDKYENDFPILVNDDKVLMEGEVTPEAIILTTYDEKQNVANRHEIKRKR